MSGLLRAELSRLRSRRLVWAILGLVLVITGLTLYSTHQTSRQFTPAAIAQQEAEMRAAHDDWVKNHVQQERDCRASYSGTPGEPSADEMCAFPDPAAGASQSYYGSLEGDDANTHGFDFLFRDGSAQARTFILFFAIVIGAGLITAEFSSGAIVNWLTFEPRRTRVFLSKFVAGGVGGLLVGAIAAIPLVLGTWIISESVDLGGPTHNAWASAGRMLLVGLGGGLLGAGLAFILRNTAAIVGLVVAYAIGIEGILAHALPQINDGLLLNNVDAFVTGRSTWYSEKCASVSGGGYNCESVGHNLYFWHGTAVSLTYLVVLTLIGWLLFRRRDVT